MVNIEKTIQNFKKLIDKTYIKINQENIDFIKSICSRSGCKFSESYWQNGSHYYTCLEVMDFPEISEPYMLQSLYALSFAMITIDVEHIEEDIYQKDIEKLVKVNGENKDNSWKINSFYDNAENERQSLDFFKYVKETKDSVKDVTLRVYVIADDLKHLQSRVRIVEDILRDNSMQGYIQINDMEREFNAISKQDNTTRKMVVSSTVAEMSLYREYNLIDSNAGVIGETINGVFAFDPYNFKYSSYSMVFFGDYGSGKSAHIKLMIENGEIRGDLFHILDVHEQEYYGIATMHNIPYISMSANLNVNPCEIFFVYIEENEKELSYIIRKDDVMMKIALLSGIIEKVGKINDSQNISITQLRIGLNVMYQSYIGKDIRDLTHDDWFTLSDVLKYFNAFKCKNEKECEEIHVLQTVLVDVTTTYEFLFDKKTNLDVDMNKSCVYDISFLAFIKDVDVVSAYKQIITDFVLRAVSNNSDYNKRMAENMGVSLENHEISRPIRALTIIEDEFGNDLTDREFLEYNVKLLNMTRKCYCGIWYVLHTTENVLKNTDKNGDLIKTIVKLCATKIIGKMEGDSVDGMSLLVSNLNERDKRVIRSLSKKKKGDGDKRKFLCINALGEKIKYSTIVTNRQRKYFKGGA